MKQKNNLKKSSLISKSKVISNKKKATHRSSQEIESLITLGNQVTIYSETYSPHLLESFENKGPEADAWTSLVCTEFTSLCPKTGQPDFAKIFINYIADFKMVESKSLKLYLFSFRNHGDFHEDCIQKICNDLSALLSPRYLEVMGEFTPRGGICIYPFCQTSNGEKKFQIMKKERLLHYAPGKYSIDLGRIY